MDFCLKRPHFVDHSVSYSSKLKTEPVKIGFTVDNTGPTKSERKAVDVAAAHPVKAISDPDRETSARIGIFFTTHNDIWGTITTQPGHIATLPG
jgi:hypothetical protein